MINPVKTSFIKSRGKDVNIEDDINSVIIIPYVTTGRWTYTNKGVTFDRVNYSDFETMKAVYTGNDAIVVNWEGSVRATQKEDTSLDYQYQVGNFLLGTILTDSEGVEVGTDKSFNEYTAQQIKTNLTVIVSKNTPLLPKHMMMFFKIPEIHKSILFKIDSVETSLISREEWNTTIIFSSVNQEFANTGKAKQQNIMPNNPGQGYLEPLVEDRDWPLRDPDEFAKLIPGVDYIELKNRYLTVDKTHLVHRPIQRVEVKLMGVPILSSFTLWGRPAKLGDNIKDFGVPRLIFPINLQEPTLPTLYRAQNTANNFYAGSFNPTMKYMKDIMKTINDSMTAINKWANIGILLTNFDDLEATNPTASEPGGPVSYKYTLSGSTNPVTNFREPWSFNMPEIEIDTSVVAGCSHLYQIGGTKKVHDHMFDWYWTQKKMKQLPLEVNSTLGFGFTLGSSIGVAVTKKIWFGIALFAIGLAASLAQRKKNPAYEGFRGLIPAEIVDFNKSLGFVLPVVEDALPFNILESESADNPSSIFFASSTLNVGFNAELTDRFYSIETGREMDTTNLGQSQYPDGTNILRDGSVFLLDGTTSLRARDPNSTDGFIIDKFQMQACFNGEYSIEFIDGAGDVAWSGVFQSEGKWTKSLREIWSTGEVSAFGREDIISHEPVSYPKEIAEYIPDLPVDFKKANDFQVGVDYYFEYDTRVEFQGGRITSGQERDYAKIVGYNQEYKILIDTGTEAEIRSKREYVEWYINEEEYGALNNKEWWSVRGVNYSYPTTRRPNPKIVPIRFSMDEMFHYTLKSHSINTRFLLALRDKQGTCGTDRVNYHNDCSITGQLFSVFGVYGVINSWGEYENGALYLKFEFLPYNNGQFYQNQIRFTNWIRSHYQLNQANGYSRYLGSEIITDAIKGYTGGYSIVGSYYGCPFQRMGDFIAGRLQFPDIFVKAKE